MSFNPEVTIGNLYTLGAILFAAIVAWVKRDRDLSDLSKKIASVNEGSQTRFQENANKMDGLASRIASINEHGSPASVREIDMLRGILMDHSHRITVMEDVKTKLAVLEERSKAQSLMMEEIKQLVTNHRGNSVS